MPQKTGVRIIAVAFGRNPGEPARIKFYCSDSSVVLIEKKEGDAWAPTAVKNADGSVNTLDAPSYSLEHYIDTARHMLKGVDPNMESIFIPQ